MYTWNWEIKERELKEITVEDYTECERGKKEYVEKYLSPSIVAAKCGWDGVEYRIFKDKNGYKTEYAILYSGNNYTHGRYYNVSGNSLGCIASEIWSGVFN